MTFIQTLVFGLGGPITVISVINSTYGVFTITKTFSINSISEKVK